MRALQTLEGTGSRDLGIAESPGGRRASNRRTHLLAATPRPSGTGTPSATQRTHPPRSLAAAWPGRRPRRDSRDNRRLTAGRSWVKQWRCVDGSLHRPRPVSHGAARERARQGRAARPVRPQSRRAGYVAAAFCAKGSTVDTAHALVTQTTTRDALYVSATRGRQGTTSTSTPASPRMRTRATRA